MSKPTVLNREDACCLSKVGSACWCSKALKDWANKVMPYTVVTSDCYPDAIVQRIVVVGGGDLMDRKKVRRMESTPRAWLCLQTIGYLNEGLPLEWIHTVKSIPATRLVPIEKNAPFSHA